MDFRVIRKEGMIVVGKKITISFSDDNYPKQVEKLWEEFLDQGYGRSIRNVIDKRPIVLYYEQGLKREDSLSFLLGLSVSKAENDNLEAVEMPESDYARFTVMGQTMPQIIEAWNIITKFQVEQDTGLALEIYRQDHEEADKRTLECLISII